MKMIIPIIGVGAGIVQLIRLSPLSLTTLLSACVTGIVFYLVCKLGWDVQKGRILREGYAGWGHWGKRVLLGVSVFLTASLLLLYFSFNNPICEETGDPFFGRCEKYANDTIVEEKTDKVSFHVGDKVFYPLFLSFAYVIGSAAIRVEHKRKKGFHDRRVSARKY